MTFTHGYSGYSQGCRCETCTVAHRDYLRTYMAARYERARRRRVLVEAGGGRYIADGIKHGHGGYTNHSCRCETCREAKRAYDRRRAGR